MIRKLPPNTYNPPPPFVSSVIDVLRHLAASEHLSQDTTPPVEYEIGTLLLFTKHPSFSDTHTDFSSYSTFLLNSCFPRREDTPQIMHSQIDLLRKRVYGLINPNPSLHWKGLCEYICHLTTDTFDRKNTLHISNPTVRVTLFTILKRLQEWVDDIHFQLHLTPFIYSGVSIFGQPNNLFLQPPFLPPVPNNNQWPMGAIPQRMNTAVELSEEEENELRVMKRVAEAQITEADMGEVVLMDRSGDVIITPIANTHCRIPAHPDFCLHSNTITFNRIPETQMSLYNTREGYVILEPVMSHVCRCFLIPSFSAILFFYYRVFINCFLLLLLLLSLPHSLTPSSTLKPLSSLLLLLPSFLLFISFSSFPSIDADYSFGVVRYSLPSSHRGDAVFYPFGYGPYCFLFLLLSFSTLLFSLSHIYSSVTSIFSVPFDQGYFGQGSFSLEKNSFITVELDLRDNQKVLYFYSDEELFKTVEIQNEATQFNFCVCLFISIHPCISSFPLFIHSQIAGACSSHVGSKKEASIVEVVSVEETSSSIVGDRTLFFSFCKTGNWNSQLLSQLFKSNLDINIRDTNQAQQPFRREPATNLSGLMYACQNGHAEIVSLLLKRPELNINLLSPDGKTALDMTTNPAIVEMLKRHGAVEGPKMSLTQAIKAERLDAVHFILSHGGGSLLSRPGEKDTSVQDALEVGSVPILECLLQHGAKIDSNSLSTLSKSLSQKHIRVVEFLAEHDVDLTPLLDHGLSLLHFAAWIGDVNLAEKQIRKGGDVNCVDEMGRTPLFIASANGHVNVIEFLHSHNGDINQKDKKGRTPLFIAARNGETECVEFILQHHSDIDGVNDDGQTPLYIASSAGNVETVEFLVEHGADVTRECKGGGCPIHIAAMNGHLSVVQFLVERGMNINLFTPAGMTPLDLARLNCQRDVVEYITQHGGKEGNVIDTMINGNAPITKADALTSLFTRNSNPASIHQEGNILTYTGEDGGNETVVIGNPMTEGIHRLNMRILSRGWYSCSDPSSAPAIPSNLDMIWLNHNEPGSSYVDTDDKASPLYDPDHPDHDWTYETGHPQSSAGLISSEFGIFDSSLEFPSSGDAIVKDGRGVRYRPYYRYTDFNEQYGGVMQADSYDDGDDGLIVISTYPSLDTLSLSVSIIPAIYLSLCISRLLGGMLYSILFSSNTFFFFSFTSFLYSLGGSLFTLLYFF